MELFPIGLEDIKCPTAWYGIDTHMDYQKHLCIGKVFDISFFAQFRYVERLKKDGLSQVFWLPLAFDAIDINFKETPRSIDIAYIGTTDASANPKRFALLSVLKERYPNNFIGRATPHEMAGIYKRSKIVFNWSINNDINMRFFEAMGSGAVLVTNPILENGLELLFTKGEDHIEFWDRESLFEKIDTLLNDENLRSAIGKRGQEKVARYHCYRHRVEQIISTALMCRKLHPPIASTYYEVFLSLKHLLGIVWLFERALEVTKTSRIKRVVAGFIQLMLRCIRQSIQFFYTVKNRRIARGVG